MGRSGKKLIPVLIEVGKWTLIIWLILPIKDAWQSPVNFGRIALGIILFVIFSGKILYDVVFFPKIHRRESSPGKDLVSMIGIVGGIALLVCLLVFFITLLMIEHLKNIRF